MTMMAMTFVAETNPYYIMKNKEHTYELWFLGDIVGEPQAKNRTTLNALLKEAHQMLTDAASVGGVVGEAEIVHREHQFGHCTWDETVWSMSMDEFTKGHRLPIKAL